MTCLDLENFIRKSIVLIELVDLGLDSINQTFIGLGHWGMIMPNGLAHYGLGWMGRCTMGWAYGLIDSEPIPGPHFLGLEAHPSISIYLSI